METLQADTEALQADEPNLAPTLDERIIQDILLEEKNHQEAHLDDMISTESSSIQDKKRKTFCTRCLEKSKNTDSAPLPISTK